MKTILLVAGLFSSLSCLADETASATSVSPAISNIRDAVERLKPKNAIEIMESPLLQPDGALYGSRVVLRRQEGKDLIRAEFRFSEQQIARVHMLEQQAAVARSVNRDEKTERLYQEAQQWRAKFERTYYIFLHTTNATKVFSPKRMRVGAELVAVGKYAANRERKDAKGVSTVPVLDVLYIGEVPAR